MGCSLAQGFELEIVNPYINPAFFSERSELYKKILVAHRKCSSFLLGDEKKN